MGKLKKPNRLVNNFFEYYGIEPVSPTNPVGPTPSPNPGGGSNSGSGSGSNGNGGGASFGCRSGGARFSGMITLPDVNYKA